MSRQVVLDTETTGLDPKSGHGIIEIGCIEIVDRLVTKNTFHQYIKPAQRVDPGAFKVHGISNEFLNDKPAFIDIVDDFLNFIRGAELIIHNAPFDIGFMDEEFKRLKRGIGKTHSFCNITDTLSLARKKHPGQKNNFDALCKRYNIDNSNREFHGALLDADLLAKVYLMMTGGQGSLFGNDNSETSLAATMQTKRQDFSHIKLKQTTISEAELCTHREYLTSLKRTSDRVVWEEYERDFMDD